MTTTPFFAGTKVPAFLALPGAGTMGGALGAAVERVSRRFEFLGVGGTSAGGLEALALAYGLTPIEVSDLWSKMLVRKDLLDSSFPWFGQTGAFRGKVLEKLLKETFGEKTRMGDLKIPCRVAVASMWTTRAAVVCSKRHADVEVWRAGRATCSIQMVYDNVRLRPDNARTYGDGGAGLNVPAGIWDDREEPTVVLRFKSQQEPHTLAELLEGADENSFPKEVEPVRNWVDATKASAALLMDAANAAFPSRKPAGRLIELVLDVEGDSLKFGLEPGEEQRRKRAGALAADMALSKERIQIDALERLAALSLVTTHGVSR